MARWILLVIVPLLLAATALAACGSDARARRPAPAAVPPPPMPAGPRAVTIAPAVAAVPEGKPARFTTSRSGLAAATLSAAGSAPRYASADHLATDSPPEPAAASEAAGEVRVWQHVDNARTIYISVRRAGGRWSDAGTVLLPLDDGHSASGSYRYGDIARGGIEVRVWQHAVRERALYISARLDGAPWSVFATVPLSLDDGHSSSGSYRYGDIVIPEPSRVPVAPGVRTIATGDRGVMILEWAGGPRSATHWQYRLRAARSDRWRAWLDIPDGDAMTRRHRVGALGGVSTWLFQVRGVVGTLAGEPSDATEGRVPTFDANGIPWLYASWGYASRGYATQLFEGGRAWRLGRTVVNIPAGMSVSARLDHPLLDPAPSFEQSAIDDAESGSTLWLSTDFGAECTRIIQPSPSGRDVNALFDQIVASARVQIEAPPWVIVAATGERGEVLLKWAGGPWDATHWEYRLRGPYPCQTGSGCDEGQRADLPWGEWTEIAGGAEARSHVVSGLPDLARWDFQVRAVAGSVAGAGSWNGGAPAVVGPDGIPQLHSFFNGEGGRTWRLGESPTVVDVPIGLVVGVSDHHSGGMLGVSEAVTGDWLLVNAETAEELTFEGGIVAIKPPCGPTSERHRSLFAQMRGAIRLQPIAR